MEDLCAKVTIGSVVWSDGAVGVVESSLPYPLTRLSGYLESFGRKIWLFGQTIQEAWR